MPIGIDDIELRSEEVQQILRKPPPSLVRWGTSVVFLALAIALGISFFVVYPSIVPATIQLKETPAAVPQQGLAGEMRLEQSAIRNIRTGQMVQVKLDMYPYEKFGILKGTVQKISGSINTDKTVSVMVKLNVSAFISPELVVFQNGMTGKAEIITGNYSIARKLFGLFK